MCVTLCCYVSQRLYNHVGRQELLRIDFQCVATFFLFCTLKSCGCQCPLRVCILQKLLGDMVFFILSAVSASNHETIADSQLHRENVMESPNVSFSCDLLTMLQKSRSLKVGCGVTLLIVSYYISGPLLAAIACFLIKEKGVPAHSIEFTCRFAIYIIC